MSLKGKYDKLLGEYKESFDEMPQDKKFALLAKDNKQLAEELKRLNEFITYLVEQRRFGRIKLRSRSHC